MSDTKNKRTDRLSVPAPYDPNDFGPPPKNKRTALRLSVQHGAGRERRAIIADLRTEAAAYGGTIGEVLLAVATRIETGAK